MKALETESAFQIAAVNGELSWNKKKLPRSTRNYHQASKDKRPETLSQQKKTGSLKFINQKSSTLYVIVNRGDYKKRILLGGNSSSEILELTPGIYDCEAGIEHNKTPLETFQVKIKPFKRSKKKFEGFRFSTLGFWF